MARYKDGPNGPLKGKFGRVIASSWRDIDYLKSVNSKPAKDPTEKQQVLRTRFKIVHAFLGCVNDCVQLAFISNPGRQTGRNAAQSYIMTNACYETETGWEIDYPKVLISFGKLKPVEGAEVIATESGITIKWDKKASNREQMIIALIDPQLEVWAVNVAEVNRQEGEYTLTINSTETTFNFHVYIGTISNDRKNASNSIYLNTIRYPAP